ncbi:hypothetical protein [Citrobacter portucalensis]|uniref:hypothetical protein n=1 Tax=Citrobacter portucalensis TaxID=1639133 RepID=UPI0024DE0658|nr:hypothetical protein [Citrobacter portucalensis]MDK2579195.1 hypothetical protein [Citrobacter portucalensis]
MSILSNNVIGKEIQKLKEIKSQLEREAPEMVTPEIVAAIYREINTSDRAFFAENKF